MIKKTLFHWTLPGFIANFEVFDRPTREQLYDDADFWEVSGEKSQ